MFRLIFNFKDDPLSKQRQFSQKQPSRSPATPDHPNIVLIDRCHPEKIIDALTAKYFQDFRAYYGYSGPTLETVRDFTRDLITGEISISEVPLAREALSSNLTKADTEDGKEFALALVEIAKRHNYSLDIDEEIVKQLFNRGLLPLHSLAPDQLTLNALSKETGLSITRISSVLIAVEQSDAELRSLTLASLFEKYEQSKRLQIENAQNAPVELASATTPISRKAAYVAPRPIPVKPDYSQAEQRIDKVLAASTILTLDTSLMSEAIDKAILSKAPDLPTVKTFMPAEDDDGSPIRIEMNPTNLWVNAVTTSRTRRIYIAQPLEIETVFNVWPVDERETRTLVAVLKARTTDIFIEAAIINSTGRFLLENGIRNDNFVRAVNDLENVVKGLDALHKNTILALRDVDSLRENLVDTDRSWRKLGNNPILSVNSHKDYSSIDLSDTESYGQDAVVIAAMLYHLPPGITPDLFNNTFGGMIWDLKGSSFKSRLQELAEIDPDGTRMDQARGWRTRYGTTGRNIVNRDQGLGIEFDDKDELVQVLRPVSERYDSLFTIHPTIMDRDLGTLPIDQTVSGISRELPTPGN